MAVSARTHEMPNIAFVGNYLPRQCGIATFTTDLCTATASVANGEYECIAVAMNDIPAGYRYPSVVSFEIRQNVQQDYLLAANFLNINRTRVVCLQHEYGIFGGNAGSYVLPLLRYLREPLITTLHTVLKDPSDEQRHVMTEIASMSDRIVVMSSRAVEFLVDIYGVRESKIALIHHGIPDTPFVDPNFYKDNFGVEGRPVILTFGLLSPSKGIEYAIEAMAEVVKNVPEAVYIILGATHPAVRRHAGEAYRNSLIQQVHDLGITDNVIFQNRFVTPEELCAYLGAADIYITPYLVETQIVSGTLAYALGTGKAVISTPYWYAQEMLAEGRGHIVPFRNASAMAERTLDLLSNEMERHAIRKRAYQHCRKMIWRQVADSYLEVFHQVIEERNSKPRPTAPALKAEQIFDELPEIDLRHLRTMTDDTGIFQHALYCTPDRSHGYTTDDNARALIAANLYWNQTRDESILPLFHTYLSSVVHAFDEQTGRFRNFMNFDRTWRDEIGSEECHGRALWALGEVVAYPPDEQTMAMAATRFHEALPMAEDFTHPRACSVVLVGIHSYLRRFGGDSTAKRLREKLSERLLSHFKANMAEDWPWCERLVSYNNGRVPHALILSGQWTQSGEMIEIGLKCLRWLLRIQTGNHGQMSFIGNNGWYPKGEEKAHFDQQPIEALALADACIEAFNCTRDEEWLKEARRVFKWFLGGNDLRTPVYDFKTGGCRDGLHPGGVSQNQGAESLLAWLISLLRMYRLKGERTFSETSKQIEEEKEEVDVSQA